jgi:transposase
MEEEKAASSKKVYKWHPIGIRRQAVSEVESGMYRRSDLCEKYGIAPSTLERWIKAARAPVPRREAPEECSATMRLAANLVLCGVCTVEEALAQHGLDSAGRLRFWVERVRKENRSSRDATSVSSGDIAGMAKERRKEGDPGKLREELEAARMRIAALETLIEVAERELGVKIRKKPGAKRSRK